MRRLTHLSSMQRTHLETRRPFCFGYLAVYIRWSTFERALCEVRGDRQLWWDFRDKIRCECDPSMSSLGAVKVEKLDSRAGIGRTYLGYPISLILKSKYIPRPLTMTGSVKFDFLTNGMLGTPSWLLVV